MSAFLYPVHREYRSYSSFSLCGELKVTQTGDASQQTLGMRHRQHYSNTPRDYL